MPGFSPRPPQWPYDLGQVTSFPHLCNECSNCTCIPFIPVWLLAEPEQWVANTHGTFCVYSLFPCPGFPESALSTFKFFHPPQTQIHILACLMQGAAPPGTCLQPLSGHLLLSPLCSSHTECITFQGKPDTGLEPGTG